jgi:hypothetical protein
MGAAIWLVLTIPVLAVGFGRLARTKPPDEGRRVAWLCTWIAGVALMSLAAIWGQDTPRPTYSCSPPGGCVLNAYGPAVVIWRELPLCAAFLALGAIVTWVLARPTRPQRSKPTRAGADSTEESALRSPCPLRARSAQGLPVDAGVRLGMKPVP